MSLFDTVSNDIKSAMLAKDRVKLEALRGVKKEFIEAKTAKGGNGELPDEVALKILAKMVKQRRESAAIYMEQNRPELAESELAEAAVIEVYMPKQLTEEELADQGIKPNTIRLSIGTEHIDDIIADLQNGFKVIKEG